MDREAHLKNKKMVCVGVGVTTNKTNVPVIKTREENKSERMHPEWKQKHTNVSSGWWEGKENKSEESRCLRMKRNKSERV
jgi:hypothetical protein